MENSEFFKNVVTKFNGSNVWVTPWILHNKKPMAEFDAHFKTNFSRQYNIPQNLDSDKLWLTLMAFMKADYPPEKQREFETFLYESIFKPLSETYKEFKGLDEKFLDVLLGVASEFAPEDIREFVVKGAGWINRNKEYVANLRALESKLKISIDYFPSTKTLNDMCQHFGC